MIHFNVLDENFIQVYGNYKEIHVNGLAHKVEVPGNQKKVWHYSLTLLCHPKMMKIRTNEKEGTLTTEDLLKESVERNCEKFLKIINERGEDIGKND
jgi:hypothetical protein